MCEDISHGVIDLITCTIADIRKISFLGGGDNLLDKGLVDSRQLAKETPLVGVRNARVRVHAGGCSVGDDEWACVSWVDKGRVKDERILRIGEH